MLAKVKEKQALYVGKRWKYKRNGKEVVLREVFDETAGYINKSKDTANVVVRYDPVHAALPWAGVRLLL